MKVNPNYKEINVKQALADPDSIFHYYRKLIRLRRDNPVIAYGIYDLILESHEQIYAFTRTSPIQAISLLSGYCAISLIDMRAFHRGQKG